MKAVVIGESSGVSREANMAVYPRHKEIVDKYVARRRGHRALCRWWKHGHFQDEGGGRGLYQVGPAYQRGVSEIVRDQGLDRPATDGVTR
jgi:hypothetical protein